MFVGRESELAALEGLYAQPGFQMVVVYGRRRVGKTTLIDEFVRGKRTIYFTGQMRSSALNLRELSRLAYECFGLPATTPPFATWSDALAFIANQAAGERLVLVLDELPYAARTEPGLPSALQVAIDHGFLQGNVFMVLCGSNEGFMESEVLGRKSPLYGRRTGQVHLAPFDFFDAARMLLGARPLELVDYYAAFGGTPYYLAQVDPAIGLQQNLARLMFDKVGLLYEEPMMLMRQELREPAVYNSVLAAVAGGATEPARIADAAGMEPGSVGKYLKTLEGLGLVERVVPFGENPARSRKGLYYVADPFFSFWYRFVAPAVGAVELGAGAAVAQQVCGGQDLPTYVGHQFERIALQWVARANAAGGLPFLATEFGRWWGTDPDAREKVDVDLVAANRAEGCVLVGECKWRNAFDETAALAALEHRAQLVGSFGEYVYVLFTKGDVSPATRRKLQSRDDMHVVTAGSLCEGPFSLS